MYQFVKTKLKSILALLLLSLIGISAYGQELKVDGKVLDAVTGEAIEGINIRVGFFSSVSTEEDGSFSTTVPNAESTLIITGAEYATKEYPVKGQQDITIYLHRSDFNSYYGSSLMPMGTQSKTSISSAVVALKGSPSDHSESVAQSVQGNVAGMRVINRSGVPSVGGNMFIRGLTSLNSSLQPLIIVDGMMMETNTFSNSLIDGYAYDPLSDIAPKDIVNITVIKDAASIYGSRAANGVILIETNRVDDISTKIDFYVQGGLNIAPDALPLMDGNQYKTYLVDQLNSSGLYTNDEIQGLPYLNENSSFENYNTYHNNTDWQDQVFDDSYSTDYYLRVTGGDEIAKYGLSISYVDHNGVVSDTKSDRFSTRFNSESDITKRLTLKTNLNVTFQNNELSDDGMNAQSSPIYTSLLKSPMLSPTTIGGDGIITNIYEDIDGIAGYTNPSVLVNNVSQKTSNYRIFGNVKADYAFTDKLKLSTLIGVNYLKNSEESFLPQNGVSEGITEYQDTLTRTSEARQERLFAIYTDTRLTYDLDLGQHGVFLNAGVRYSANEYENSYSLTGNASDDQFTSLQSGDRETFITNGSLGNWKSLAMYASADYDYLSKYFVSLNVSTDASSRFGDNIDDGFSLFNQQFGVFPSISSAWLVSSEKFMNKVDVVDQLKLRVSYGLTGNDAFGNYIAQSYFKSTRFLEGTGLVSGNFANSSIKWETTRKLNVGADLGLFNERLQLNADVYSNTTEDLLSEKSISPVYGYSSYLNNDGELTNKGYELAVNARIINGKDFKWDAGGNISKYTNEITSLAGGTSILDIASVGATIINQEGSAIGLFYGYETDGIYSTNDEAATAGLKWTDYAGFEQNFVGGDVKFKNQDGNDVIDEDDRVVIGDPNPDFTGMFYSTFSYKDFALSAVFTFSQGNDIYNALRRNIESMDNFSNQSMAIVNRWKVDGQNTSTPRAEFGDPTGNGRFSDRWIEDGSYLRFKTLQLTYSPKILTDYLKSVTFSVTANNLITFTDYLGYDPEVSMSGVSYHQGIDAGLTPQFSSVLFGVKLGL